MTDMTDQELDELVRQAQPHPTAVGHAVDHLGLRRAERDLLEEIMSTPVRPQADSPHADHPHADHEHLTTSPGHTVELGDVRPLPVGPPRKAMRVVAGIAAAAAVLAAVAVPALVITGKDDDRGAEIQNPAGQETLANGDVPRVLLRDPAWTIGFLQNSTVYGGDETYVSGDKQLVVRWTPAGQYQVAHHELTEKKTPEPITVLGQTGVIMTGASENYTVLLPVRDGAKAFLDIEGINVDRATFTALLAKLEIVPNGEWEAALPPSVVTPAEETQVAQKMLTGVPLPPGFDAADLPTGLVNDYYQYGAVVINAVTCGWLKEYRAAQAAQDEATMAKVDAAMATSRDWAVLTTMEKGGGYPDVVWEYADKVSGRKPISAEDITQAFGCSG